MPPNPACRSLTRQGFRSVFQTALRSLGNRSIVVVGNYEFGPITAEPCRAKARPLRPRRSYFAPADAAATLADLQARGRLHGWRRRVLPPGPIGLLRRRFIAIAGLRRRSEYRAARLTKKDQAGEPGKGMCAEPGVRYRRPQHSLPRMRASEPKPYEIKTLPNPKSANRRCCRGARTFGIRTPVGDSGRPLR